MKQDIPGVTRLLAPDKFTCVHTCIDMIFGTRLRFDKTTGMTIEEAVDKIIGLGGRALWSHRYQELDCDGIFIFGDTPKGLGHCILRVGTQNLDPCEPPVEMEVIDGYLYVWRTLWSRS